MKHFKLTNEVIKKDDRTLHRIVCTRAIGYRGVIPGTLGGFVESEENIEGDAWVADDACVMDRAVVSDYALIRGRAEVFGDSKVKGRVIVEDDARVYDRAVVSDYASLMGCVIVRGDAFIGGSAVCYGSAVFGRNCVVAGDATVGENAYVLKDGFLTGPRSWLTVSNIGSRKDTLSAYRSETGVMISVGCFCDSLEVFEVRVKEKHGKNVHGRDYMAAIELIRSYFGVSSSSWRRRIFRWLVRV